jgi:hypothetical protein
MLLARRGPITLASDKNLRARHDAENHPTIEGMRRRREALRWLGQTPRGLGCLAMLLLVAGGCDRKLEESQACELAQAACRAQWAEAVADLPNYRRNYQVGACKGFKSQGRLGYRDFKTGMFSCPQCGQGRFGSEYDVKSHFAECKPSQPNAAAEILVNVRGEHRTQGWTVEDEWLVVAIARVKGRWEVVSRCSDEVPRAIEF